jgi:hypothetical protein
MQAVAATSEGSMVFLGLTPENVRRLTAEQQPIRVRLDELDPRLPPVTVVLFAGDTDEGMAEHLQAMVAASRLRRGETAG